MVEGACATMASHTQTNSGFVSTRALLPSLPTANPPPSRREAFLEFQPFLLKFSKHLDLSQKMWYNDVAQQTEYSGTLGVFSCLEICFYLCAYILNLIKMQIPVM